MAKMVKKDTHSSTRSEKGRAPGAAPGDRARGSGTRGAAETGVVGASLAQPRHLFSGRLTRRGDALILETDGGMEAEVLTAATAEGEALASARRQSVAALKERVGQRVSLTGRQEGGQIVAAQAVPGRQAPADQKAFQKVREVLAKEGARLRSFPGVLDVRPGYRFKNGWITKEPAVVVLVRSKVSQGQLDPKLRLPDKIGGVDVDVTPASPAEQLLAERLPLSAQSASLTGQAAGAPGAAAAPSLTALATGLALPGEPAPAAAEQFSAERATRAAYTPPPDAKLDPVTGPITLTFHSSPDAGWPTLGPFLAGVEKQLTVAMYDFTAPHIFRRLDSAVRGASGGAGAELNLILDPGESLTDGGGRNSANNPKAGDIHETEVVGELGDDLGKDFTFEWAAVSRAHKSTGAIFPTAYHIKVAVRDGKAMWLSSGNWQSSNQPNIDPLGPDADLPGVLNEFNREWHVIAEHEQLARTYEKFILHDMEQARPFQAESGPVRSDRPDLLVPEAFGAEATAAPTYFKPLTKTFADGEIQIQPLLTPDNYADFILPLIQSARQTLDFQNQYIHVTQRSNEKFDGLFAALKERIEAGVKVRIILRDLPGARAMVEALQANGLDAGVVKLQKGCHNKGIIVDGRTVVVGSHNWSAQGVAQNRDASLIIENEEVAAFYQKIFDFDWQSLARQTVSGESAMPQIAAALFSAQAARSAVVPQGYFRVPWAAVHDGEMPPALEEALESASPASAPQQAKLVMSAMAARADEVRVQDALSFARTHAPVPAASFDLYSLRAAKAEQTAQLLRPRAAAGFRASAAAVSPMPQHNVVGVAIAEKYVDDKPTGILCVKYLVRVKYPPSEVSGGQMLPKDLAGIPTDVEEAGAFAPLAGTVPNPRQLWQPAQPGCSIGFQYPATSPNRMAGTFGAVVEDGGDALLILSNNHVLANESRLKKGAPIFQAGLLDLVPPAPPHQIGRLLSFVNFTTDQPTGLRVDCALAAPLKPDLISKQILYLGSPLGVAPAAIDMAVHKFGRTTAYTAGQIISVNADVNVDYETGSYTFEEQILIAGLNGKPFSGPGDSGALILERGPTQRAVGLLFAGTSTHTAANHINDVLQALSVTLA